jgi:hypothetical protein
METTISNPELHTIIRKELAPTRLEIHDIWIRVGKLEEHAIKVDERLNRLEILVEGLYVKFDHLEKRFDRLEAKLDAFIFSAS